MESTNLSFNHIKETCLYVSDLHQTRAFYEGKLGLKCFALSEGRHVFFRAGSSVLLCFIAEATKVDTRLPTHYGTGTLHFAFESTEGQYDAWREKLVNEGITIEQDVVWPNDTKSFYFRDPDDHCVEIVQPGLWDN